MIRILILLFASFSILGCQVGYLLKNSWHQQKILKAREPIKKVLKKKSTDEDTRRKLKLVLEAKKFAEEELGLNHTGNYDTFVDLGRPYVTWVVRAAPPYELKSYNWWFPIVGSVPYKGYFSKAGAKSEAKGLKAKGLDTFVRGVTAYSTLGWFDDPVLSSMLRYEDHDLVNVIIHETVHATVFIEDHVDFNERLATFVGNVGAEIFFRAKSLGNDVLKQVEQENLDQEAFSDFISKELKELKKFYRQNKGQLNEAKKSARLQEIQQRFKTDLKPKLKTDTFAWFESAKLNNAMLMSLETYQADLSDFQKLYELLGKDFRALIEYCKDLEGKDDPEQVLKAKVKGN